MISLFKSKFNFWKKSNQVALNYFKKEQTVTKCEHCGINKATKFCKRTIEKGYCDKSSRNVHIICELKICDTCTNCFFHKSRRQAN
jgi:hypothetical protein